MEKKILLIEDEKMLVDLYRDKFIQSGFKVFTAFDVKEGINLAKKEKPDLIILDILLPGENGITFLEKIKKEPLISSVPIIAFSNYDDPKTKEEAFQLGVKDYLIKTNHTPSEIVSKIEKLLVDER